MNHEDFSMNIILHAGNAKGYLHESLQLAKNGEFEQIDSKIKQATEELLNAHKIQTKFIQEDAEETMENIPVILVHAQDHLMTVMSEKQLIIELIEMYRKQHDMNLKLDMLLEQDSPTLR
ncbi:PTS lactose/cellobiose transporter subunit IIA [Lentibacillus salicampi]|uniref:PTS lactose/cellobiose transporter subunit IIA n=1 Tax=Lentibacillus salicampi TaxID=175306 RepID=A0A4Y9A6J7_9BACI|nr:PTS lactose/cellobiose transporter subunit IIA [Lentibacillus salicampi]TFJ91263.1 PTS lactose/cellobiose transporter subunit IIA [Lentibacillus salicampi]